MTSNDLDYFKCNVRRFNTIDSEINELVKKVKEEKDKLKPLNDKIKELKNTKIELQSTICGFMTENDIKECKLSQGSLLLKESKKIVPLKKDNIKENLTLFVNDILESEEFKKASNEVKVDMLYEFIYNRTYNKIPVLRKI